MLAVNKNVFDSLTELHKNEVNEFIEYLHHKEAAAETKKAVNDALIGNTVGSFDSVEELMAELDEED